jgi:hypothetical protein
MQKLGYTILRYGLFLLIIGVFLVTSCGEPIGDGGKSPVFLYAHSPEDFAVVCDVYTSGGNPTADTADIVIESIYKNQTDTPTTEFATVTIEEYRVHYYRFDGNPNVPEPFTRPLRLDLPGGGDLNLNFIVVRAMAKQQSPLKELAFGGGEGEIWLTAHVEFYGQDLAGNAVSADVDISVKAADY